MNDTLNPPVDGKGRLVVASFQELGTHVLNGDRLYCDPDHKVLRVVCYAKYEKEAVNQYVISSCKTCEKVIRSFGK